MTEKKYEPDAELELKPEETGGTTGEAEIAEEEAIQETQEPKPEKTELELANERYNELNDRYLRLMAEYDNYRKRSQKEREDIYPNATASTVGKFLPVVDSFERAAAFPHGDDDFGKGFDMIYQNLKDVLASLGVEEIGKTGEKFDPAVHNAVMHIEDENLGENVVSAVMQKGYRIGDKIIRYAMVQTAN